MTDHIANNRYHVIPINDLREHEDNENCWCNPDFVEDEDSPGVFVHHSMDRREEYETGRRPS